MKLHNIPFLRSDKTTFEEFQFDEDSEVKIFEFGKKEHKIVSLNDDISNDDIVCLNNDIDEIEVLKEDLKEKNNDKEQKEIEEFTVYTVKAKDGTLHHLVTQNLQKALKYINQGSGPKNLRTLDKRPVSLVTSYFKRSLKEAKMLKKQLSS